MSENHSTTTASSSLNEKPVQLSGPFLLHDIVAAPSDTLALEFLENGSSRRRFSYRDLHTVSDQVARQIDRILTELENASAIIPILLPQSSELYIALLAVLKAGKAFCPLNLDSPPERLGFILQDVSADLVITSSKYKQNTVFPDGIRILAIDELLALTNDYDHHHHYEPPHVTAVDLAYVLYTSGSTGLPKAVGVSHQAVTQSLLAHDRHIPRFTRFLQFAAPTFDVSIFEIFFPWFRGCTIVGSERTSMLNDLPRTIDLLEADAAEFTPTVVNNLLRGRASVPRLKVMLTIGEMLTENMIDEYGGSETQNSILWAMYGPTEAAIHCTIHPKFASSSSKNDIGYPLDTVSAFVAAPISTGEDSSTFLILPRDEVGELVLGGPQIATGYLNRPELTASAFFNHPEYGYLYRTGDKAKIRIDGTLECLGRLASGQVKLHGQRIELGEVEHSISRLRACRAVAVMVLDEVLVAFCVCDVGDVTRDDVLDVCRRWLPTFMVPSQVVFTESMPQLSSGKIDKRRLEFLFQNSKDLRGQEHVSDDSEDHIILQVLRKQLGHRIDQNTDLNSAGLDSLQAIKLASSLREQGFDVSATTILSASTPADLVQVSQKLDHIHVARKNEMAIAEPSLPDEVMDLVGGWAEISRLQYCTSLQEAMLAETIARPSAYCNWVEVALPSPFSYDDIRNALQSLAESNEMLRSGFQVNHSETRRFLQIVWKALDASQIRRSDQFCKEYTLATQEELLRPFMVQIQLCSGRPRLLFQIHHALYDGWSFDLMMQDLERILNQQRAVLHARPQFVDVYSYYHNISSEEIQSHQEYWTDYLANHAKSTLLNYHGQVVEGASTGRLKRRSGIDLSALTACARDLQIAPQVYFQTALAFMLSEYFNSKDVLMGNVTSGRTLPITGIENIIGPCVASVPFRLQFNLNVSIQDTLQDTQRRNRASLEHCPLSLRDITKAANVQPGSRLFDVLFVWQQSLNTYMDSDSCIEIMDSADELEFRLTLEFEPCFDHISARATFDSSILSASQVNLLIEQIDDVVQYFIDHPEHNIMGTQIPFSDSALSIANPEPRQAPISHGLSWAVEKWASVSPEKTAIVLGATVNGQMAVYEEVSYAYLNQRANKLAHHLIQQGITPDSVVAIIMEKSTDLYVAILATLKTGSGYLPLVPDLPIERIKTILTDAKAATCITDGSNPDLSLNIRMTTLIHLGQLDLSTYSESNLNVTYDGSRLAYAIFTSGSTGVPKGVLVTQDNIMSNLEYLSSKYPTSAESRLLQACSQAFDVSVFEIFFAWHVGMTLCTSRKDDLFRDLEHAINAFEITHLSLTPSVAALVDPDNVPKVEFLVTAGEAVTEQVRRKWAGRGLWQGYGPSETTNICTIRPSVSTVDLINNIGKPFANTSAFVLDPQSMAILPRGAIGELCFGGSQVFRGYLNRPELNAAKIIHYPKYGRLYRSGDMGVLLPDDSILFTGRADDQVKIRGQRVELGEITSAILDASFVHNCATFLLRSVTGREKLVAFWVPESPIDPDSGRSMIESLRLRTAELFGQLCSQLPMYMIPAHIVPIDAIPMTAQSKIDRRSIQKRFEELSESDLDYSSNTHEDTDSENITDAWEVQVAHVLAECVGGLSRSEIQRNTSFYKVGLDSISAIHFSNALRNHGLGDFKISAILRNSTVKQLASIKLEGLTLPKHIRAVQNLETVFQPEQLQHIHTLLEARKLQFSRIRPCTPLQEAMLSSSQSSVTTAYCNVVVFTVHGDFGRLQHSWKSMVQRHDILRTSFIPTENSSYAFAQVVMDQAELKWETVNVDEGLLLGASEHIANLIENMAPPVYFAMDRSARPEKMIFCCHHALYDGIAISNLLQEVQATYCGTDLPSPMPYDLFLQQLVSQDINENDRYWSEALRNFEPTYFPDVTGRTDKAAACPAVQTCQLTLSLQEARAACRQYDVSLLSLVQATWSKLLYFILGESDFCFGNVVSGRNFAAENLEQLVAPCFNTLPVRVNFDFGKSNEALLTALHQLNVAALDHQLTPLRQIQNLALRNGGRLFDTLVILQQPSEPLDKQIWSLELDEGIMDFPIVCEISQNEVQGRLHLTLHHQGEVLTERDATLITEMFDLILQSTAGDPQATASDTSVLPVRLRAEQNMAFTTLQPDEDLLHTAFERNASRTPEHIALDFLHPDGTRTIWSYKRLNEEANKIAHILLQQDVQLEEMIPVHIGKSPLFYASILGILKAGAVFAPIHPDLPVLRKQIMIKDLGARYMLCTSQGASIAEDLFVRPITVDDLAAKTKKENPRMKALYEENLAYCLFTSGSTGVPKAVSVGHRAPIHTIQSSKPLVPYDESSKLLQYAATTFDMCYYDCFLAWTLGFTLCAAEQQQLLNELPQVVNTLEIDLLDLTPSVAMGLSRKEIPSVKWLYCIGEAMLPEIVAEWEGSCVNSYGPTEAAFCTTMFPVSTKVKPSVLGKPFPSTSFAIFSPTCNTPLPLLSIGELHIGGAQLAREYLGRTDLNSDKFVTRCAQRFYRTGDIVRCLADGTFEFVGRADDQVKIRGLRVELGEINHVLCDGHQDVSSVVSLILRQNSTAKDQLVAFIVEERPSDESCQERIRRELKQIAKERLPAYMVPQFFLFTNAIPKSVAGKVDKKALLTTFIDHLDADVVPNGISAHGSDHKWTRVEEEVRHAFSRLSKVSIDEVTPDISIYQLGLDSISAVQIATILRRKSYVVNASDVMKYPSCVELAEHIEKFVGKLNDSSLTFNFAAFEDEYKHEVVEQLHIADDVIEAIRPCTALQSGMLSQSIAQNGMVYFHRMRLQMKSDVAKHTVKKAWEQVILRHPMLRTGFRQTRRKDHPFAMVLYRPNTHQTPWTEVCGEAASLNPQIWLAEVQKTTIQDMSNPPWCLRWVETAQGRFLDIAMFHALFDAHSLSIILSNVIAVYNSQTLPPVQALDPVIGHILIEAKDDQGRGKAFWTGLRDQIQPCRFPNLSPLREKPQLPTFCTYHSSTNLIELENLCKSANTTIQAVGVATWLSLLSAYTGSQSVTCGVVLSGRNFEAATEAVLPCITTVPKSVRMQKDDTSALEQITRLSAEVQQYQHTPLSDIQRYLGYPSEPLFDTLFAYQKVPAAQSDNGLWSIVEDYGSVEYPLSMEMEPSGERLEYRLTYLPHIIPHEHADLILRQFDHTLQLLLERSTDQSLFPPSLYSITPAEEETLLSDCNLLHELVEASARDYPDRVALEFASSILNTHCRKTWTYAELDIEGNKIAHLLIENGVHPGELVGVCFDKCAEASFAMLGILKAGCAFVAIDPSAPAARQVFIVQDSGARAVLTMNAQSTSLESQLDVPILNLDRVSWKASSTEKPLLSRKVFPQDRSYCLYTSGTTGTPKGCELTHENAVQAMLSFRRLFANHWDTKSRWLQFASFHFDVSILEQFWSWSVGICVVSATRDLIFEDLANSINSLGITHIDLTPSLAQLLHPDDVPSLCRGVFITGGESLKQEILDVWGPKAVIYNGYGPTEATIGCTMYPRVPSNGKPSNIGSQFDNVGTLVLVPGTDQPVLRGAVGELCVLGKLVGKGYLNREDLTARSFPHLDRFGQRVYRTGDLVRILHNNNFEFLGRADDQVKLRGQRLEIGEINSVIRKASQNISDVATLVVRHNTQQKEQLVSFVVIGPAKRRQDYSLILQHFTEIIDAKSACQDNLPPYMVPTSFIPLTGIPLNVNNKADARKLKDIYDGISAADLRDLSVSTGRTGQTWSSEERILREITSKEFDVGVDSIAKDSSFFELGMDSISVIAFVGALKHAGYESATASIILRNSTISRLAKVFLSGDKLATDRGAVVAAQQMLSAMQHSHRRDIIRTLGIDSSEIESLAPCTPLQQGMIAKFLESDKGLYFNNFVFKLSSQVEYDKLRAAWEAVHMSTQILRTVFVHTDDGHMQVALRNKTLPWYLDSTIKQETINDTVARSTRSWLLRNEQQLNQPFELIHVSARGKQYLVIHAFHGLYDGISIELVFDAVRATYLGQNLSNRAPTFMKALSHGPLKRVNGAKSFWQDHLHICRPLFASTEDSTVTQSISITRSVHDLTSLEKTRRRLNVTTQAIVQSSWLMTLRQYFKKPSTSGMVVSGRSIDLPGAEKVVGPMFNTIPFELDYHDGDNWESIIRRVHDFNIAAHPYHHTPLRDILRWCKVNPGSSLFDSIFVYQMLHEQRTTNKNELWQSVDSDVIADYPLALEVEQLSNTELSVTLVAQKSFLDDEDVKELLSVMESSLRQLLEDTATTLKLDFAVNGDDKQVISRSKPVSNGQNGSSVHEWTDDARKVRDVLVSLTGTPASEIAPSTTIFELGLDSIDAIKLSSRLKAQNINLPVSAIMRALSIEKMLSSMPKSGSKSTILNGHTSHLTYIQSGLNELIKDQDHFQRDVEEVLPPTPLQEAMIADMLVSDFERYYNFDVMELDKSIDICRLRNAWFEVVAASPILRTSFLEVDDTKLEPSFAQVIHRGPHEFWSQIDHDQKPDFQSILRNLRTKAAQGWSTTPSFSVTLIRTPRQAFLILSIAHALYDGWSLSLLHEDIRQAYHGTYTTRPHYRSTLSIILSASGSDAATFWKDCLEGAKPSNFPDLCLPSSKIEIVHRCELVSKLSFSDVSDFAKGAGVSLQSIGQTAFAIVVAYHTKSLDVTFGAVLSGRDDETASQVLFPTMNTIAVRTILHGSSLTLMQYVQNNFNHSKSWQQFPLRKALASTESRGALFNSLFIYQKNTPNERPAGQALYSSVEGQSNIEYPVCVEMEVVGENIVWRCAVNSSIFDQNGARELLERIDQVCSSLLQTPESPVLDSKANGISVCGLPPFKIDDRNDQPRQSSDQALNGQHQQAAALSNSAHVIKEVMSAVSGYPEDELTNEMTIFNIGLDSISAIKVSSHLRKQGITLSVGEMLRTGTIASMAELVDKRAVQPSNGINGRSTNGTNVLETVDRDGILLRAYRPNTATAVVKDTKILPATAGQIYMLSMWLNSNGENFYADFYYTVSKSVPYEVLNRAWGTLVSTNAILRTRFVATEDHDMPYVQVVDAADDSGTSERDVLDLTNIPDKEKIESVRQLSRHQPWAYLFVIEQSAGWNLRLRIHHALYDGVSLPILMRQFDDICCGLEVKEDYLISENLLSQSYAAASIQKQREFWQGYLGELQPPRLSQPLATRQRTEVFKSSLVPAADLDQKVRTQGITIQALFLAAYARVYAGMCGCKPERDVVIGVYLANRSNSADNIENWAVPTVNLLPLRVSLGAADIFGTATKIQEDLRIISDESTSLTSLWNIKQWTDVRVDTFVNFLSLPDGISAATSVDDRIVRITQDQSWSQDVNREVHLHHETFNSDYADEIKRLRNDEVNKGYLHAVDVEASVANGTLSIGVFAPTEMLSLQKAQSLVEEMKIKLEDVA